MPRSKANWENIIISNRKVERCFSFAKKLFTKLYYVSIYSYTYAHKMISLIHESDWSTLHKFEKNVLLLKKFQYLKTSWSSSWN